MINGIPGNMAVNTAKHLISDDRFKLILQSLTGHEIEETTHVVDPVAITLIRPEMREEAIVKIIEREGPFISVDYTHPLVVNSNAEFFCRHNLPFVMGTTGGDRKLLENTVFSSSVSAVIAPNMAKQIVGFQAMMEYGAKTFPGLFEGYSLEIKESHQKGKADTSGTAKAMVSYFNRLGIAFSEKDIIKERDPNIQKIVWGIPEEYLEGHGWHTYTFVSGDKTARFVLSHNVNGRDVYAMGTLDAISYLHKKVEEGIKGRVFTMIDVLKSRQD